MPRAYHGAMSPADARPVPRTEPTRRRARAGLLLAVATLWIVAGCVPIADRPSAGVAPPSGSANAASTSDVRTIRAPRDLAITDPLLRTAWEAWLLMELGRLRSGSYTTDVLLDLAVPQGIRWTVVSYGPDAYALAVTGDGEPTPLRVDPDGVRIGS